MAEKQGKQKRKQQQGGGLCGRLLGLLLLGLPVFFAWQPAYLVGGLMLLDHWMGKEMIMPSAPVQKLQELLLATREERPAFSIPELHYSNVTREEVLRLSDGFTFPIVIRGAAKDTQAVQKWGDKDWWIENYGDEELLMLDPENPFMKMRDYWEAVERGEKVYVSGTSSVFERRPELREMLLNDLVRDVIEPNHEIVATQMFMGIDGMGETIHNAVGCNVFRQVVGEKNWWFIPVKEMAYMMPSMSKNGISAYTTLSTGAWGEKPAELLNKIERYTTTLHPGDVMINPPWFWHAVVNQARPGELVIGSPTRYGGPECMRSAMRSAPVFTANMLLDIILQYGSIENYKKDTGLDSNGRDRMERAVSQNRGNYAEEGDANSEHGKKIF